MAKPRTRKPAESDAAESQLPEIAVEGEELAAAEPAVEVAKPEAEAVTLPEPEPESPKEDESSIAAAMANNAPTVQDASAPATARSSFLPMLAGGLIAALIGAGATLAVLPNLPQPLLDQFLPETAKPVDLSGEVAAQKAQIAQLSEGLTALKATSSPSEELSGVKAALDQATAETSGLKQELDALVGRVESLESRPAGDAGAFDTTGLQAQIDALKAELAQAGSVQSATQEQIAAAAAAAQAQIADAQAQAEAQRASSEAAAQKALAQAAVARVSAAFDAGANLAPALADAAAAGITVPDGLKGDIPTLDAVKAGFADAARAALAIARRETAGQSIGDKIGAFLLAQTGARSLTAQEGSGPDAVLSRAQAAVDGGDLPAALGEIAALTPDAQGAMQTWVALAQARIAAAEAVAALSASMK